MAGVGLPCATCRIYYAVDLKRCPVCQKENRARPQGAEKEQEMSSRVAILVAKAEADAVKVKNAILKAMQEVDGVILPEAAIIEPIVAQAAAAISPGGAAIVNTVYAWFEACAKLIDAGGAAAEQNLANAGLDVAAIASVKALIPQLKAAAKPA